MICGCIRTKSAGIKLACAALILAVLCSWSILVARKDISPAEAWIILSIVGILWMPASCALWSPNAIVGEGVATVALLVAQVWNATAMCLFWGSYYKVLPILGTSDVGFFFTKVSLKHWFRTYMLVLSIFQAIGNIVVILGLGIIIKKGCDIWLQGKDELDLLSLGRTKNESYFIIKFMEWTGRVCGVLGVFVCALGVTGAELMIKWNMLTPVSDLSLPGQSIPLAIGIVIFVDSVFGLCQPKRELKYSGLEGATISGYFRELAQQREQMKQA